MAQNKQRLDKIIVDLGLAENRSRAQALIMAGKVRVNDQVITKSGTQIANNNINITVDNERNWASRGAYKLLKAFEVFNLNVKDKICVDIGASTGGFTDVLIENGAKKVYAVDVGYGQLIWRLVSDSRVVVMDRTNARNLERENFNEIIDFISCDASFISLKLILPVINKILTQNLSGEAIVLIKPQFEAGRERLGSRGVVRDKKIHADILNEIINFILNNKIFFISGLTHSPILGPEGNIEFLCWLTRRESDFIINININELVSAAHNELKN